MIQDRRLITASAMFNGSYLNGAGKTRKMLDEVIGSKGRRGLLEKLGTVTQAIESARTMPEALGRWGFEFPRSAGATAMEAQDLNPNFIADISLSELDPATILTTSPEKLQEAAEILLAARGIARQFHEFHQIGVNAD